jgi:hypothetical protein
VYFDFFVEKKILIHEMETLEDAVSSFLHVCFVANMKYPKGSGLLCTLLQRWVSKLAEQGTTAARLKKDQSSRGQNWSLIQKSVRRVCEDFWESF